MLAHHQIGAPCVRAADIVENALKYLHEESARTAGEIEDGYAPVVGEPVGNVEACFQDVVHRADNEIDDRRRRVVDTTTLAHGRVVGLQIILVEVDERIALEQPMLVLVRCPHLTAYRLALPERQVLVD
jgi:hypothetical protein